MSFLSGISIVCFAASYAVAFGLELTRLVFRSRVRGVVMVGFAAAGLFAQTIYLVRRAIESASLPLSSSYDWCLLAAWMLALLFLYLSFYYPRAAVGLYLWPLVLGLIGVAAFFADPRPIAPEPASRVWGMIHGIFLLLGTVIVMVGFVAGLMYLLQANRLKRKHVSRGGLQLPSLERLEHINSRVLFASALMVGIGFLAGIVLNLVGGKTQLPWTDPVVWSSGLMLAWLVAAALFNVFYKPARHGRKVAYLTVANFVFLTVSLGTLLFVNNQHGRQKPVGKNETGDTQVKRCQQPILVCHWLRQCDPLDRASKRGRLLYVAQASSLVQYWQSQWHTQSRPYYLAGREHDLVAVAHSGGRP